MLIGLAVAGQWRTGASPEVLSDSYYRGISSSAIQRLEAEQQALQAERIRLQEELAALQREAASRRETLAGLSTELEQQRILAGLTPLHGPGVYVLLQDSLRAPAANENPARYQVADFHVRDVVQMLWQAGAEAIAVNSERIVASTAIAGNGGMLLINASRVLPPYEVRAIGNPERLERALNDPASLRTLKAAVQAYGLGFRVQRERDLMVPAYRGAFPLRYVSRP